MTPSEHTALAAAVRAGRAERIDWRFRSVAPALDGRTLDEAAAQRANLFTDGFFGPFVILDAAAVEHNLTTMAAWCAGHGIALAPHGKTTMAPELFLRQLEHGAWGVTAANAGHLRIYRAFGVSRILLANQLVDPAGLRWLAGELAADPAFEFVCWADSVRGVELMTEALTDAGASRPVDVLVELGGAGGRTGVRDQETALAVAEAIAQSPALRLRGTGGYEGTLSHDTDTAALAKISSYVDTLRDAAIAFAEKDLLAEGQVYVTAGGSAYFDRVAEELTKPWPSGMDVLPILRSGAYVTHDDGFYREISPLGVHPRLAGVEPFHAALHAWAQVTSKPTAELALLTAGKRDLPYDEGMPEPQLLRKNGSVGELAGHTVTKLNDQHAFLALPADSPVEVGDWVRLGLSHPCTTFDKWPLLPVVDTDGETVVDFVRTWF